MTKATMIPSKTGIPRPNERPSAKPRLLPAEKKEEWNTRKIKKM
jgi:hypothetical protein